ncbi:hypothetical protein [Streptomyces sp. NPDC059452]|uniref:hypothetical protein n=1 Tax=Streptomyces sp. NPDC059452 TaxID=3346835 RepID=UPI0036A6E0E6
MYRPVGSSGVGVSRNTIPVPPPMAVRESAVRESAVRESAVRESAVRISVVRGSGVRVTGQAGGPALVRPLPLPRPGPVRRNACRRMALPTK